MVRTRDGTGASSSDSSITSALQRDMITDARSNGTGRSYGEVVNGATPDASSGPRNGHRHADSVKRWRSVTNRVWLNCRDVKG